MAAMRLLYGFLLIAMIGASAPGSDEREAVAVVQKIFDGIAGHDGEMIRANSLPEARLYAVRDTGAAPTSTAVADMAAQIGAQKVALLERFTSPPQVLIRGRMAQVWGEYEFQRDGKFSHCGVDSASLMKTAEGWKIAAIAYTVETKGCKGQ
jgi:hypothetical protein